MHLAIIAEGPRALNLPSCQSCGGPANFNSRTRSVRCLSACGFIRLLTPDQNRDMTNAALGISVRPFDLFLVAAVTPVASTAQPLPCRACPVKFHGAHSVACVEERY